MMNMNANTPFDPAALAAPLGPYGEQMMDAGRETARLCLEAYESTLESIAGYQEASASQTSIDWVANAQRAQAKFVREVAKQQVAFWRELLD